MKKLFFLAVMMPVVLSCDYILRNNDKSGKEVKAEKKVILGTDKDSHGCVTSAGYKWSVLREECIRVFEEGYRLNPIDRLKEDDSSKSAFVVFDENKTRAELFLPGQNNSLLLDKEGKEGTYKNPEWELHTDKDYSLLKNGIVKYAGAAIQEKTVTGDDNEGS